MIITTNLVFEFTYYTMCSLKTTILDIKNFNSSSKTTIQQQQGSKVARRQHGSKVATRNNNQRKTT